MNVSFLAAVVLVGMGFVSAPSMVFGQEPRPDYKPLSNQEMSQAGIWETWIQAFDALTGKQRAEVVRRHISFCLEAFEMTEEQRSIVREYSASFVTEEAYSLTSQADRTALANEMKPAMEQAQVVLGNELFRTIFHKKPPIAVIEAVRSDPRFK